VGGIKGGVQRRATSVVAVLIAILAVLLVAAPAGSAAAGPADEARAAVATAAAQATAATQGTAAAQATAATQGTAAAQATAEAPGAGDRLDALPPLRHHLVKAAVARHRSGGHPLPAVLGRAAMFVLPAFALLLVHRCARATQAPPGRLAMSYPMRT
jgi:hypothetical protein